MKCDIPAEVGAHILRVARAEHRVGLEEGAAGDEGDQGLEGHEEAGDADHVIVEAGEAACAAEDRSGNTELSLTLGSAHWTVITMVHCGQSPARWARVSGVYSK